MKQLPTTTLKGDQKGETYENISKERKDKRKTTYDESKHFVNITVAFSLKNSSFFIFVSQATEATQWPGCYIYSFVLGCWSAACQVPALGDELGVVAHGGVQSCTGTYQTISMDWGHR